MVVRIGGVFLFVKGYLGIEQQELAMRLGKEGGEAAALMRNQLTFWSSYSSRGHFLSTVQASLSYTPHIPKTLWMYYPRNIHGPFGGDRH
jgi:hypothetical protein